MTTVRRIRESLRRALRGAGWAGAAGGLLLALCCALPLTAAKAHVPYLAPASFEPVRGWVSLEAAFAEQFFLPEAKFDQSEFQVFTPAGGHEQPAEQAMVRSRTVLEHQLKAAGTYRFSVDASVPDTPVMTITKL